MSDLKLDKKVLDDGWVWYCLVHDGCRVSQQFSTEQDELGLLQKFKGIIKEHKEKKEKKLENVIPQ